MNMHAAIAVFECLSSGVRLDVYKLLVRNAPHGCVAGEIATQLRITATSLSFHLKAMTQANLLMATHEGRYIRYQANLPLMLKVINFLTLECCAGTVDNKADSASNTTAIEQDGGAKSRR
ncbi:helix-turn-helix domain-containing protein [Eoetvoesia caeni]|nr:helix-turn-helix domain-containing protein [Eoetvoesiella caeni]MCI2808842.1 helix-turn-helix domain-containing protein [Eoetvoesiella caeni]